MAASVTAGANLISDKTKDVAGLDRFALLLLACQPCQPCQTQLVMDPNQRVHLHSLLIEQCHLSTPRPVSRMPPLQEPSVSAPIRWSPPLTHRSNRRPILSGAGRSDTFYESSALRSLLDTGQRFQSPPRVRACTGLKKL